MALMMGGAAPIQMDDASGASPIVSNPSLVLPPFTNESMALMTNPFLHISSSMPSLIPSSIANSVDASLPAEESVDMEEDDDSSTEDGQLRIDAGL